MRGLRFALVCAGIVGAAAPASATVVTSIRITNAVPTWLQISEVIATQTGTGADVALATAGAVATTSSTGYGTTVDPAIDGVGPAPYPNIYHSGSDNGSDYLLVTLAQAYDLSSLTVDGRQDSFGIDRDLYGYELFNGTDLVGSGTLDARNDAHSATVALDVAVTPVPEPATWAMMLAGFGAIGATLRRRRPAPRFA